MDADKGRLHYWKRISFWTVCLGEVNGIELATLEFYQIKVSQQY